MVVAARPACATRASRQKAIRPGERRPVQVRSERCRVPLASVFVCSASKGQTSRMLALVTGAAGFIGSNLVDGLLASGHQVRGVDCFTDYYDPSVKRSNLSSARDSERFHLVEADLRWVELDGLLSGVDVVLHQSAQPGVRLSWADGFSTYDSQNILVTQRLLEACRRFPIRRFVYASSSSVYGNACRYPTTETDLPNPHSPYGVTKLSAEHLCGLYASNWGVPTVSLRYFTVYGPRQRPDMAFHRLIEATLAGSAFPLYGTGQQIRDFTYVGDVVAANMAAADADLAAGEVMNIAGGGSSPLIELIELVGTITGTTPALERLTAQPGDVQETGGSIDKARALLGWSPQVGIAAGLEEQVRWHRDRLL